MANKQKDLHKAIGSQSENIEKNLKNAPFAATAAKHETAYGIRFAKSAARFTAGRTRKSPPIIIICINRTWKCLPISA